MKLFVVILCVTLAASIQPDLPIATFKTACIEESNVESTAVQNLNIIKFDDTDSSLKKFVFCLNKKLGLQNDAGEFQIEVIKKDLRGSQKEIEELLKKCLHNKNTPAEAAYEALKCVRFNDPRKKSAKFN